MRTRGSIAHVCARFISLALVLGGAACTARSGATTDADCAAATRHLEVLRAQALLNDPVLAQRPNLAAEHARQTAAVFDEPLRAKCASNPEVARCVTASASLDQAQKCL